MSNISKTHLYFWQPIVNVSAPLVRENAKRAVTITAGSHCRALLNRALWEKLANGLTQLKKSVRSSPSWTGSPQITVSRTVNDKAVWADRSKPARLGIAVGALRPYKRVREGYSNWMEWVQKPGPVSLQTCKDFYYLADLLCGTFGVLMSPNRQPGQKAFISARGKRVPQQLSYRGVDSIVLLHPALPALFLGQLRLAAFLAATGQAATIRKTIPEALVSAAILEADRGQCAHLLRKAAPWVLRSENGLWVFKKRGAENYQKLLTYLEEGGNAFTLFGKNLIANWKLSQGTDIYGPNHHSRGFNDFMSRAGRRKLEKEEG